MSEPEYVNITYDVTVLSQSPPKMWSPEDVLDFLTANQANFFLSDADIELIRKHRISGLIFIGCMTRGNLMTHPFWMRYGPAATIDYLRKYLLQLKHGNESSGDDTATAPS